MGASAGAVSGVLSDVGINDDFMKKLADSLKPNSSVLFVLIRSMTPDKVVDEIKGFGGTIIQTSLSHDDQDRLQTALNEATLAST